MSTSFSPTIKPEPKIEALPFAYPQAAESGIAGSNSGSSAGTGDAPLSVHAAGERREETIREAGRQEGEANARGALEKHLQQVQEGVRVTLTDFASERRIYFERVESEVVKLALSIARKILHRESQVDPLLLEALVRVALDRVKSKTKVVVRVHPGQAGDCRTYFAQHMGASDVPEVVEDPELELDHCILQTELGTTELGLEFQLKEIEQGLMDLLALRPQAKS